MLRYIYYKRFPLRSFYFDKSAINALQLVTFMSCEDWFCPQNAVLISIYRYYDVPPFKNVHS